MANAPLDDGFAQTIPHLLKEASAQRGSHPALVDARSTLTFAAFHEKARGFAAALVKAGMETGDCVAIWLPNCNEWAVACLGAQMAGGCVVPINTRNKARETAHALGKAKVRFLTYTDRFVGNDYRAMLEEIGEAGLVATFEVSFHSPSDSFSKAIAEGLADAQALARVDARFAALSGDEVSDILFTSGTTGAPKGVVTTHRQNVAVYREFVRATTLNRDDRFLLIWPFCHCSGYKGGLVAALIAQCTLFPEATLDIDRLVQRTISERITFLPGPPTLFLGLLEAHRKGAGTMSTLRVVGTGGTTIDPAMIAAVRAELGAEVVYAGYGLTECCGTAAMIFGDDPPDMVLRSSGRAIAGTELAAMSASGEILPPGAVGELVTRGINVMSGYLDDPQATAEAIDADGWLHTGDLGTVDEQGFVSITGRAKEMYIAGGYNCYPAEIENILATHPGVREVAVIGIPDERLGEVGCAYVVTRSDTPSFNEADLTDWARNQMANYKVPRIVRFVDTLPRNAMGKVEKFRLAKDEAARSSG